MRGDLRVGSWLVQPSLSSVSSNGSSRRLEPKVMAVLLCLAEAQNAVVSKQQLMEEVWKNTFVTDDVLTRCVSELRDAFGDDARNPVFIQTIPKQGYRLLARVEWARDDGGQRGHKNWNRWVAGLAGFLLLAAAISWEVRPPALPRVLRITPISTDEAGIFATLYTDGSRIYFNRYWKNGIQPAVVSAGGGEGTQVSIPSSEAWISDISPDGEQLLLSFTPPLDDGPIFLMSVLGGSTRRLGNVSGHDARWSRDGRRVVYGRSGELRIVNADGSDDHQFIALEGNPRWPRWSPDSKHLRFTLLENGKTSSSSLWEVSALGTNLQRLLSGVQSPDMPSTGEWTPDGRYFVFAATRDGLSSLWILSENRSLLRTAKPVAQLTVGPMDLRYPVPSRDGKKIFAVGTQQLGELARYDAKTKQFVRYLSGLSAEGLAYSPDLRSIAYTDFATATLYRSQADGQNPLQLTVPPLRVKAPRWSPDGKRIAFMGHMPAGRVKIYVVLADGGTPEEVAAGTENLIAPSWSADGRSLVFGEKSESDSGPGDFLYQLDLQTRVLSKVEGSEGLHYAIWSPNGHYLAAATDSTIRLLSPETHQWSTLSRRGTDDFAWSHDSQYVYLYINQEGIFRIHIRDWREEKVADTRGFQSAAGDFGFWLGLTPDNAPLLLRNLTSDRIYALDWEAP